jgi:hypothetical protein
MAYEKNEIHSAAAKALVPEPLVNQNWAAPIVNLDIFYACFEFRWSYKTMLRPSSKIGLTTKYRTSYLTFHDGWMDGSMS